MRSLVPERTAILILAPIFFCGFAGCGKSNAPLHGTVTYDGKPVERGTIVFIPAEESNAETAQQQKVNWRIIDGKYAFTAERSPLPGKYRVEITWDKIIGKNVITNDNVQIQTEQLLPEKYNTESTLIREIKSDGKLDFDLEK